MTSFTEESGVYAPASGRRRALVVGIDDYEGVGRDLPSCIADARFIASMLRDVFAFEVIAELHDAQASFAPLMKALELLLVGVGPSDRVVLYYSGHGAQTIRNGELRESLVLYDKLLHDDLLVAATQGLPLGVFTVVLDACFSGGLSKVTGSRRIKSATFMGKSADSFVTYRPFGRYRPMIGSHEDAKAFTSVQALAIKDPRLNALLVSACRENETAAASTPATNGLSAFTYAFGAAIRALGRDLAIETTLQRVSDILRQLGMTQSPQLHPPVSSPMNALTPFLAEKVNTAVYQCDDALMLRAMKASLHALLASMK